MNSPINMIEFVRQLPKRLRGKSAIVLTCDYLTQKDWASKLAQESDVEHIHLLDYFNEDDGLSNQIREFTVDRLFEFLMTQGSPPVLIVSGMEFLMASWVGQPNARTKFLSQVESWNHQTALLFVVQYDAGLANYRFSRFPQYRFIIDQKETLAI